MPAKVRVNLANEEELRELPGLGSGSDSRDH
jgi:DNA uptake protein ComE-like DNA-binding protein